MRRAFVGLGVAALLAAGGCQHGYGFGRLADPTVTVSQPGGDCDGVQARVETKPCGDMVIHLPRQKVAPECAPAAPCSAPAVPQPVATPLALGGIPAAGFGGPMVNAQVRERTGFGLVFDTIRIPLPILRPVAVPRPSEVTYQVPPQAVGFGAVPAAGFGVPLAAGGIPLAAGGVPVANGFAVPGAFGAAGFAAAPAGPQITPQQLALLQALAAQSQAQGAGAQSAGGATAQGADDQLEELIKKCEELKKLKAQRDQLKGQAEKDK